MRRLSGLIWKYRIKAIPLGYFLSWPHGLWKFVSEMRDGCVVLDVGCGEGGLLKAIKLFRDDIKLIGIDKDEQTLPDGIQFFNINILKEKIPFDNESVDYAFMTHVLEHLQDPAVILAELKRVLKHGGKIYIEAPSLRSCYLPSISFKLKDGMPINFYDDPSHIRPYSKCALWHLLKHWFKPVKVGYAMNWFRFAISPLQILIAFLLRKRWYFALGIWALVGWAVYAVAEKE